MNNLIARYIEIFPIQFFFIFKHLTCHEILSFFTIGIPFHIEILTL